MEIQITAIKFETVNGKKTGKSFSFKADPKKLAVFKTEATLKKKIKEYVAKSNVFKKEELDDVKYNTCLATCVLGSRVIANSLNTCNLIPKPRTAPAHPAAIRP